MPLMARITFISAKLGLSKVNLKLSANIDKEIKRLWGDAPYDYSLFCGTPGVHQKITLQVSQGKEIKGYCKLSSNETINELFIREHRILNKFNNQGLTSIPKILSCGKTEDGISYFIQSTTKTLHSRYPHQWNQLHEHFLSQLHEKTKQDIKYEETDFYATLSKLKNRIDWLDGHLQSTIKRALKAIDDRMEGKTITCSAYHADFTPWNMYVEKGTLYVFDWEYALMTCPPGLDRYHFFTQTQIFESHQKNDEILKNYRKYFGSCNDFDYLCYLVLIISIYIGRETNKEAIDKIANLRIWTDLVKKLLR